MQFKKEVNLYGTKLQHTISVAPENYFEKKGNLRQEMVVIVG